ncbi:hypothetical protein [Streptomyces sp. BA2]|uniref:hypothetical protein n=1 Tax=Streptomyces sp. BA2 TaxID=436595 RepID=UPI00132A586F|nr:hypothetical protein [Streptomyces sp. BA2]MWA14356.1 hypothetical protein [Streptomyces sp. BA2]
MAALAATGVLALTMPANAADSSDTSASGVIKTSPVAVCTGGWTPSKQAKVKVVSNYYKSSRTTYDHMSYKFKTSSQGGISKRKDNDFQAFLFSGNTKKKGWVEYKEGRKNLKSSWMYYHTPDVRTKKGKTRLGVEAWFFMDKWPTHCEAALTFNF